VTSDAARAEALRPLGLAVELDAALAWCSREPWRTVLVGRVGAGKTTLANHLAAARRPVGLGGVTAVVEEVECSSPGATLVDTPGIDGVEVAIDRLEPVVAGADAVVWVVDGLQPGTRSERAVLERVVPTGMSLHVVITRADLIDEAERGQVLDRVRGLARSFRPVSVCLLDLRAAAPQEVVALGAESPRRRRRIEAALEAARGRLEALPPVVSDLEVEQALRQRWHEAVRHVAERVEGEIATGEVENKAEALRRFARQAPEVPPRFLAGLREAPWPLPAGRPDLPGFPSPTPSSTPLGALTGSVREALGGFGGREGARRVLRAQVGRWSLDGDLAIAEWMSRGTTAERERQLRREAARALDVQALPDPLEQ
jgi:GTP-binding protein EngB required for normal cell division